MRGKVHFVSWFQRFQSIREVGHDRTETFTSWQWEAERKRPGEEPGLIYLKDYPPPPSAILLLTSPHLLKLPEPAQIPPPVGDQDFKI
jgi:hypothetical protein